MGYRGYRDLGRVAGFGQPAPGYGRSVRLALAGNVAHFRPPRGFPASLALSTIGSCTDQRSQSWCWPSVSMSRRRRTCTAAMATSSPTGRSTAKTVCAWVAAAPTPRPIRRPRPRLRYQHPGARPRYPTRSRLRRLTGQRNGPGTQAKRTSLRNSAGIQVSRHRSAAWLS